MTIQPRSASAEEIELGLDHDLLSPSRRPRAAGRGRPRPGRPRPCRGRDRRPRRSRRRPRPGSSAARSRSGRVVPRRSSIAGTPATPIATSVVPCRNGRPNESVTITPTSTPASSRMPVADAPGRSHPGRPAAGRACRLGRVRVVDAGGRADEAVPGLGDHERRPRSRTIRFASRRITSTSRGSRSSPASSSAFADASTSSIRTTRPSAFDTAFCATTTNVAGSQLDQRGDERAEVVALPDLRQAVERGSARSIDAGDRGCPRAPCSGGSG